MNSLYAVFEAEGVQSTVGGNNPFFLDGVESVWMVLSGSLEIFTARYEDGRIAGRKQHFFSAREGQCVFGMDLQKYGWGHAFQAVGFPGTRISCLNLRRFAELAVSDRFAADVARGIEEWVAGLLRGLTQDVVPRPKPDLQVVAGKEITVPPQRVFCAAEGMLWVEMLGGASLYLGMDELGPDSRRVPLNVKSWIQTLTESRAGVSHTGDGLAEGWIWPSLEMLYEHTFQILILNTGFSAADEYNLLLEKTEADRLAGHAGLAQLAGIMGKLPFSLAAAASDDAVFAACNLVADRLGIELREAGRSKRQSGSKLTLEDVLRNSRVNARRVALRGDWWKEDNGPLVAFLEQTQSPVALLPAGRGRYQMVDPAKGSSQPVNRKLAESLAPFAFTLYRYFRAEPMSGKELLRFALLGSGRDFRRTLILGAIIGISSLAVPIATGIVFESVIPQAQRLILLQIVVILLSFSITNLLFEIPRNVALLRIEVRGALALETAIWDRLLRLPTSFFRTYTAGDLAMRGMALTMIRQIVSSSGIIPAMAGFVFAFLNLPLLFYYQYDLAWVATVALLIAGAVVLGLQRLQVRHYREISEIQGRLSGKILQFVTGISKLRVAGSENRAFGLWARDFSRQKKLSFRAGTIANIQLAFITLFPLASLIAIFAWLGLMLEDPTSFRTGDFMAFNAAWASLAAVLVQMATGVAAIAQVTPLYRRARPILEAVPEVDVRKSDPGDLLGRIEVCHAYFRYTEDGPMVLRDVSLRIEPGEFVALVGPSGSGKSTLLRLLLGFERPISGAVYYDDQDLAEMDLNSIRRNMGVVMQGANLMPGSILTNIVGTRPLTIEDAWEAARMAGLDDDIKAMPMGMHTVVMQGAATLSGGQRQRLMIARAIVNQPRILIFDEATAALDNRTQAVVNESLKRLKSTRVVVAHRLSTIQDADRIYVLDRGQVVETGNYEQLMAQDGLFAGMGRRQLIG
jgi:NHLM bacteriocin system ABC transporter ATP-binding protein